MSDFILDLATLKPLHDRVVIEAPASEVGLPVAEWKGLVRASLRVERSGTRVTVRGDVACMVRLECFRCLREFELEISTPFTAFADRRGNASRAEEELLERDDYMLFHDGRKLDLRDSVRETLLLELPISPRCREDCPGLCPKCGADLNLGPCGCAR